MSRSERTKGRAAEAEVAKLYRRHGFEVRGLEGAGDHLAIGHGLVIHSEVKRQEVLRLPLWTRQALAEAPAGAIPIVSYRRNREQWQALALEERAKPALHAAGLAAGLHYSLRSFAGGPFWASLPLLYLLRVFASAPPLFDQAAQLGEAS